MPSTKRHISIDEAAIQLNRNDFSWLPGPPSTEALVLTYGFLGEGLAAGDAGYVVPFDPMRIAAAEQALQSIMDVANVQFVRVSGPDGLTDDATILFAGYKLYSGAPPTYSYAHFPHYMQTSPESLAGNVYMGLVESVDLDQFAWAGGIQHELLHAMGLDHLDDYSRNPGISNWYQEEAQFIEDTAQYSRMSYWAGRFTGASDYEGGLGPSMGIFDVAALQLMYGQNTSAFRGDTVYGANSNTDRAWLTATTPSDRLVFTIWDAAGDDTLDLSIFPNDQLINLNEGAFSNAGQHQGWVGIAKGTTIENAVGGPGHDTLIGNATFNRLFGGKGNDTIDGGGGEDTAIFSGRASDYTWSQSGASWTVQDRRGSAGDGQDLLRNVEFLEFVDQTVRIGSVAPQPILTEAFRSILLRSPEGSVEQSWFTDLSSQVDAGSTSLRDAIQLIVQRADGSTAVAAMAYQFFLGFAPSKGGFDFLVNPEGPNPNNLNSAYYQFFNTENRYINFAVNLGKVGEGKAAFETDYGSLTLRDATREAYKTIFGGIPSEGFLSLLLDADVGGGLMRKDYFAVYGGDGPEGLGTKAAMVGWLLTEAAKADLGLFARSSNAYLTDLADGALFLVDIVGVYSQPEWVHQPGG